MNCEAKFSPSFYNFYIIFSLRKLIYTQPIQTRKMLLSKVQLNAANLFQNCYLNKRNLRSGLISALLSSLLQNQSAVRKLQILQRNSFFFHEF